jgi:putative tail fiber protein|nr:MAG TPA: tail collar fiber protein [Caudoviricetes sp.]
MANLKEQEKWEDGVYQIEENDPVLGGENGITNKPIKQLANRTLWLKKTLELFGKKSTPKDLVADSTSTADGFGHSHKLPLASISDKGIVKLNSQTASDSEQDAATPKAVKIAYDKAVEAKTAADNAQRKANEGVSKANEANNNAEGRVSKSGDRLTGILYSVGISSKHYGYGAYANQYTSGAPFMVETTGSQDRDTYHPFVKGLVRSKGRYGAGFSLGYTTKQGQGDGFGRGIIHLIEDNGANKTWAFEHNGDFVSPNDVLSSSGRSVNKSIQHDELVGEVAFFASSTPPSGWLKANGAAVSRTTYAALFAAIGTTFGAGDGRTTFNLPDLRGEFLRGLDEGRNIDRGRRLGTAQGDAIRNITGKLDGSAMGSGNQVLEGKMIASGAIGTTYQQRQWSGDQGGWGEQSVSFDFDASRVVPTASENRPRNVALLACIKY